MKNRYERVSLGQLRRLADGGDAAAKAELSRRRGEPVEATTEVSAPRRARRLQSWQRPLVSTRYAWWGPQVGAPSYEMHVRSRDYWRGELARERAEHDAMYPGQERGPVPPAERER